MVCLVMRAVFRYSPVLAEWANSMFLNNMPAFHLSIFQIFKVQNVLMDMDFRVGETKLVLRSINTTIYIVCGTRFCIFLRKFKIKVANNVEDK